MAGETISLFKYVKEVPNEKRIIQLKPVDLFVEKNSEDIKNTTKEQITEEIKQLELQLDALKTEQSKLLEVTKIEIEKEKANWKNEKENLINEAKEKGYEDGFLSGKQESLNQYRHLLEEANQIIHKATEDYHATLEKSEETIIELATYISEKILKQKLKEEPAIFISMVKDAIKQIEEQSEIRIFLHPKQYEFVLEQKDELMTMLGNEIKLSILIKDELQENSCILEHPFGRIDASVDTQLEQLRQILQDIVQETN